MNFKFYENQARARHGGCSICVVSSIITWPDHSNFRDIALAPLRATAAHDSIIRNKNNWLRHDEHAQSLETLC
jgi:hypothetical protein